MCELCHDSTPDAFVDSLRDRIAEHRFVVLGVGGSRSQAELTYTAGLAAHGLPELVVAAVRPDEAARLLRHWGEYLLDESAVLAGECLHSGPWLLEAVDVERPHDHLPFARQLYGDRVRALQLVWADGAGRWPWERGHQARRSGQPLLGRRAPQYCDEHAPDRLDVPPHL